MKLSEIIIGSFFVMSLFLLIYWLCEQLAIVPFIGLYDPPLHLSEAFTFELTRAELIISMILICEISWVGLWILWFKIRGYKIEW